MTISITNDDELYEFMEAWEELAKKVAKIATTISKLEGNNHTFDEDEIHIEYGSFKASFMSYSRCDRCPEMIEQDVPSHYIFDDSWLAQMEEEIRVKEEREQLKKEQEAEKRKLAREDDERKQYLKLKEKYS